MKYRMYMIMLLAASILLMASCQKKAELAPVPERKGLVNDLAEVFSKEQAERLITDLENYEKETCHQIIVLTVPALKGEKISDFSARTAQLWDIGQDLLQNGVLLTVAMQEGKVRIEAGPGLDFLVKDGAVQKIIDQDLVPEFKQGRMAEGIVKGVEALKDAARSKTYPEDHRPAVCD